MDDKDFNINLGAVLKAARASRKDNMSQYALADSSGFTRRYVQMVESGRQGITLLALFSLADALEISPAVLVEQLEYARKNGKLPESVLRALPAKAIGRPKK